MRVRQMADKRPSTPILVVELNAVAISVRDSNCRNSSRTASGEASLGQSLRVQLGDGRAQSGRGFPATPRLPCRARGRDCVRVPHRVPVARPAGSAAGRHAGARQLRVC